MARQAPHPLGDDARPPANGVGEQAGAPEALGIALSIRSLQAMTFGQSDPAEVLADQAHAAKRRSGIDVFVARPVLAVQRRLELAGVAPALADLAWPRKLVREIGQVLRRQPGLGTLVVRNPFREAPGRVHLALADLAGARMPMGQIQVNCLNTGWAWRPAR